MRRGTTPSLTINLDYKRADIAAAWVSIAQNGTLIIDKTLESEGVTIEDVTDGTDTHAVITMTLTQSDTLQLSQGSAELQVRALMVDETAAASNIAKLTVKRILKDGEITLEA